MAAVAPPIIWCLFLLLTEEGDQLKTKKSPPQKSMYNLILGPPFTSYILHHPKFNLDYYLNYFFLIFTKVKKQQ
jgi:hypothetical protein